MLNRVILASCLFLLAAHTSAAKLNFLKDSVLTELNEADHKSFRVAANKTLETVKDKETVFWQGETGVKGKMQAQFSYESDGIPCRRVRFAFQNIKKHTEAYKFDICKTEGSWKIAATPASSFSKSDWQSFENELEFSLNTIGNGNPGSWVAPSSRVSGVIVPLTTETEASKTCRNVAISLSDRKGRTSDGQYRFCQQNNHSWERDTTAQQ
jgi:surface antigen